MATIDSFRAARWLRTFNLVLQAILFLTFFGGLNYVARNRPWRFDLTRQHKFSLSPETLSYIKNLPRPVHVVITLLEDNDNPDVHGLLDEYAYATAGNPAGKITIEFLDVYRNRRRAEELGVDQADILTLVAGDKRRVVLINDLFTVKNKQREAFQGEQVLTAALLDVSSPGRQKIYFLVGHSELRPEDADAARGLSALRDQLKLRNFDVEAVDLGVLRKIPADASLLVAVSPRNRYAPAEQELLRQYLGARAGRLILFLAPGLSTAALGLESLLLDWGVLVHDDIIHDTGPENLADNQDLQIWAFLPHPITKTLLDYQAKLTIGLARTVMPDPGRALGSGLNTVTIAATSKTAWGERDFRPGVPARYDPGIDTRPLPGIDPPDRLGLIVASERLGVRDNLPFSVPGGKLVVFGTGDLVSNARIDNSNLAVFLNAVNWSVERDHQLNIPPRPIERLKLSLSASEFMKLRYTLLLGLPGVALLLGLLVHWTRRS
ncbi:MAG: GldG family protein [Verrucomicrobia bacterium]|nr:GldG family protein [Verrucomicrobiota bacterium]